MSQIIRKKDNKSKVDFKIELPKKTLNKIFAKGISCITKPYEICHQYKDNTHKYLSEFCITSDEGRMSPVM